MKSNNTRIFQGIFVGLALFFIATNDFLMALSMSLIAISLESTEQSQCDEKPKPNHIQ
ncbi:MAG: hypothetical protein AAFN11_06175 [Chloroflexota bacterium]